jgi:phosphatidylglycerol lysyltransferase
VLRLGWNTTAYQLLNPGLAYWFAAAGDACAGYFRHGRWWIVAGAPVASEARLPEVVAELEAAARKRAARVAYFGTEGRLEALFSDPRGRPLRPRLRLGAQPLFDPALWPATLARHASLRAQLSRARNKEVVVREWSAAEATDHPALLRCLADWLEHRGLPPLEFLTTPWTLSRLEDRRIFVAERRGEVAGLLVTSPVPARRLALVEQIVRSGTAPNGTNELLIDAAFRALETDFEWITLGLAPLADRLGEWEEAPAWLRLLVRWARAQDRKSTRLNSSHNPASRMPSSA